MSAATSPETSPDTEQEESIPRPRFSLRQRISLTLITWAGVLAVRLIVPTLRVAVSFEEEKLPQGIKTRPIVVSFWHNCIFPSVYIFRNLGIRVMASESFDGEWIGRIINKFGFVKVAGSSSRGAVRGLMGMRREIEQGWTVAFTIDGPRGPRYVAKPGPILLASATGAPMVTFHVALENPWILKTWDRCMLPKPFSRALLRVSHQVFVPADADREKFLSELQAMLERVRDFAEANVGRVGSKEFPVSEF